MEWRADLDKVLKVINSCKTKEQMLVAIQMAYNLFKKYRHEYDMPFADWLQEVFDAIHIHPVSLSDFQLARLKLINSRYV